MPPGIDRLDADRVLIGWKNTREARRAVRDAMPFLTRASRVVVASIDDGIGPADPGISSASWGPTASRRRP